MTSSPFSTPEEEAPMMSSAVTPEGFSFVYVIVSDEADTEAESVMTTFPSSSNAAV